MHFDRTKQRLENLSLWGLRELQDGYRNKHGKRHGRADIVRGNFWIVEDYAPLFSEENLFFVEMFDETFNILHIYSL